MSRKLFCIALLLIFVSCIHGEAQDADTVKSNQLIFSDNFAMDPVGKFPANWLSNRPGEIVVHKSGKWLKMHTEGTYLPLLSQDLPSSFTVEFDFIYQSIGNGNTTTELTLFGKSKDSPYDALFPGSSGVKIILETFIVSALGYNNHATGFRPSNEYRSKILQANTKARITIHVNDTALRILVNGFECLQIPQCWERRETLNAVRFYLWGSQAEPMISNVKIY